MKYVIGALLIGGPLLSIVPLSLWVGVAFTGLLFLLAYPFLSE